MTSLFLLMLATGMLVDQPRVDAAIDAEPAAPAAVVETPARLLLDLSVGALRGRAREFVFDAGTTVSRLDWDLDNVAMFKAGLDYLPRDWLRFYASGAINRSTNAGLVDYDFDAPFCPPAAQGGTLCVSTHPHTELERAYLLDLGLDVRLLHHRYGDVSGIAGYRSQSYAWRSYGGAANYAGALPAGVGISYQQWWRTPYLGIGWTRSFGAYQLSLRGSGSTWASAHDRDHHHLRSLLFTERFRAASTFALSAELGYQVRPGLRLTLSYDFERWLLARGDTRLQDLLLDADLSFADAAGVSLYTQSLRIGAVIELERLAPNLADIGPPVDVWRGSYAGLVFGPLWRHADWRTVSLAGFEQTALLDADTRSANFDSVAAYAGFFLGHRWRRHAWLWSVEADFGRADANDYVSGIPGFVSAELLASSPDVIVSSARWDSSVRLRLGRALSATTQAYVTGGVAAQYLRYRVSCLADGFWCTVDRAATTSTIRPGWTLGAGLETALARGWFARAEYRYTGLVDFSHEFFSATPIDSIGTRLGANSHRLLFGLGLRF